MAPLAVEWVLFHVRSRCGSRLVRESCSVHRDVFSLKSRDRFNGTARRRVLFMRSRRSRLMSRVIVDIISVCCMIVFVKNNRDIWKI